MIVIAWGLVIWVAGMTLTTERLCPLQPGDCGAGRWHGPDENRRYAMRALGYITAVTIAAASAALAPLLVMSVPDMRRYLKIRKM